MQDVFMHVGMPKAGSTSIQLSLNGLDDGRIRYARLGPACHSAPIVFAFSGDPTNSGFLRKRNIDAQAAARLKARYEAALRREIALGREALVISGEAIGSLTAAEVAGMDAWFAALGCRLHVFSYVREPVGFASSAFQQSVKGERGDFEMRSCRPGYRRRHQRLVDALEPGRLTFLDFRRENLRMGSVVPDFAAEVGIDMAAVTEVRANESLSAGAVGLLYFWNQGREALPWAPENNVARSRMLQALTARFPGRFRLSLPLVRTSTDDDDIAWMEGVAGFPLRFDLDAPAGGDAAAIGSEEELAAARDAALPELAVFLDTLGIEAPRKETAFFMMRRLFRHFTREARREIRRRKVARRIDRMDDAA